MSIECYPSFLGCFKYTYATPVRDIWNRQTLDIFTILHRMWAFFERIGIDFSIHHHSTIVRKMILINQTNPYLQNFLRKNSPKKFYDLSSKSFHSRRNAHIKKLGGGGGEYREKWHKISNQFSILQSRLDPNP